MTTSITGHLPIHVSFTPADWSSDPWALLAAAEQWRPMPSVTLERFDLEGFRRRHDFTIADTPEFTRGVHDLVDTVLETLLLPDLSRSPRGHVVEDERTRACIRSAIQADRPIEIVLPSFAGRPANPQAHKRVTPDLSELYALHRLQQIAQRVRTSYAPGVLFRLILDGRAYRPFYGYMDSENMPYQDHLDAQISMLGATGEITTTDLTALLAPHQADMDRLDEQIRLDLRREVEPASLTTLAEALRQGTETTAVSAALIEVSKSGSIHGRDAARLVEEAQRIVRQRAEHTAFEYAVLMTKMRRLDVITTAFPRALRGTMHAKPGQIAPRLTHTDTVISPWHGVALCDAAGGITTKYESFVYANAREWEAVFIRGDEAPFYYRRLPRRDSLDPTAFP